MRRYYWVMVGLLTLVFGCVLASCAVSMLPSPAAESATWAAMSEVAASNRLFAFLSTITFGTIMGSPGCLVPIIIVLLAFILWRAAKPGA